MVDFEDKVQNENSSKDYYNLFIYSLDKLDIEKSDFFSTQMKQLYLWDKNFNTELKNLPKKLQLLSICSEIFNKNLAWLPDNLEYLYINSNHFNSNLTNLPNGLKVLSIVTSELTIKLDNLPQGLKILHVYSEKINNPDIFSYLPETLECLYINCYDLNKINLSDLPTGLKVFVSNTHDKLDENILENLNKNLCQKCIRTDFTTKSSNSFF